MSETREIVVVCHKDGTSTVEVRNGSTVEHATLLYFGANIHKQVDAYLAVHPDAEVSYTDDAGSYRAPDPRTIDISGMPWGNLEPLRQPGDGLPVSAPTDDIGAEPMTDERRSTYAVQLIRTALGPISAVKALRAVIELNLKQAHDFTKATTPIVWTGTSRLAAETVARQLRRNGWECDLIERPVSEVDVEALQAERDALAAQLARVQAVWAGWPTTEPRLMDYEGGALNPQLARDYALFVKRRELEAAVRGEAK